MKGYLFFILFISGSLHAKLNIFWWNVENLQQESIVLEQIASLAEHYDLIILGEIPAAKIEDLQKKVLGGRFSHVEYEGYPASPYAGVAIFSKYFLKRIASTTLDWGTALQKNEWIAKYKEEPSNANRVLSVYEILVDGVLYRFSAAHLVNPWGPRLRTDSFLGLAWDIFSSISDPLFFQAREVVRFLSQKNLNLQSDSYFLIGDFNSPSDYGGGTAFRYIRYHFKNLMKDSSPTFVNPKIKIDHAFGNSKIKRVSDAVLNFSGSDHYPITLQIE